MSENDNFGSPQEAPDVASPLQQALKKKAPLLYAAVVITLLLFVVGYAVLRFTATPISQQSTTTSTPTPYSLNWLPSAPYPSKVQRLSCAEYGNYLYCVGGSTPAFSSSVYYAPLTGSGAGVWNATTSYPVPIWLTSCQAGKGYIYCIGGQMSGGVYTSSTYYANITGAGIGEWHATTPYPIAVGLPNCELVRNYIDCVGGFDGSNYLSSMYFAPVSSLGIGNWSATTQYPIGVSGAGCNADGNYIVCVGGLTSQAANSYAIVNSVYYARVINGSVKSWTGTTPYPVNADAIGCSLILGRIFCVGGATSIPGINGTATTDAVYYARVVNGSVGAWSTAGHYPVSVRRTQCYAAGSGVCCVGGAASRTLINSVYCSLI